MDNLNFVDNMAAIENIQPLMELIENIMSIPEENLNEDNIDVISGITHFQPPCYTELSKFQTHCLWLLLYVPYLVVLQGS